MFAVALACVFLVSLSGSGSEERLLDGFEDSTSWQSVPADGVATQVSQAPGFSGNALRLDFDFAGHKGWAGIRKLMPLHLPANYEFSFRIRGDAPVNNLEFKLIDSNGQNVWWVNRQMLRFPTEWQRWVVKKRHVKFAWGPAGGGEITDVASVEFAVVTGSGGKGTVWFDELMFRELPPEKPYAGTPVASASSSIAGSDPAAALDDNEATVWRSDPAAGEDQSLTIDFREEREYGGAVIDWDADDFAVRYTVQTSMDGRSWEDARVMDNGNGGRDFIYMPEADSRYIRMKMKQSSRGKGYALRRIEVKPLEFSASANSFFSAIAQDSPPGMYPRTFRGQLAYWTVVGADGDPEEALFSEDGALEVCAECGTVEPFLYAGGHLFSWQDSEATQSLEQGYLPHPAVQWNRGDLALEIAPFAAGSSGNSSLVARYVVRNMGTQERSGKLLLAIRPFQVNPPSQFLNVPGGATEIRSLKWDGKQVEINRKHFVIPLEPPAAFGAATFDAGDITEYLRAGALPASNEANDSFGYASGAFSFDFHLAPGASREVVIVAPFQPDGGAFPAGTAETWREQSAAEWKKKLDTVTFHLPAAAAPFVQTLKSNLTYILINRDGAAIQPGSRSYSRSWIRDASLTSSALLRLGHPEVVRDFIKWFARYQYPDGKIPCCVDLRGADPVPENDSHGEFLFLVAEYFRFTKDRETVAEVWPNVVKTVDYIDSLRRQRRTAEFQEPSKLQFFGLLPPSISHEGYANPMHSYWDDFFALKGLKDAEELAAELGHETERARFASIRDEFRMDLYASLKRTMEAHHIDYLPGCADLGDFDATSTTTALSPCGEQANLPQQPLLRTFQKYYEQAVQRKNGTLSWDAYTPYELRNVGAFVRLGWKDRAMELLDFFMADRRPAAWNQWAEVVWRDPRIEKYIGDMPHTWVGSDYIRSFLDLFAYERESDRSLVLAAGIPEAWLANPEGISVQGLRTPYGILDYTLRKEGDGVRFEIAEAIRVPPGGMALSWPLQGRSFETVVRKTPASVFIKAPVP